MKAAKEPPSADLVLVASVVVDILIRVRDGDTDKKDLPAEQRADVLHVVTNAIAEYLRRWPRSRADGSHVSVVDDDEIHFLCLFCRENLSTLGAKRGQEFPPPAFWAGIHKHCELCAAMFLAGMIEGVGPGRAAITDDDHRSPEARRAADTVVPVKKLKGRALLDAAREAAEYLDIPAPVRSRYGVSMPADAMRKLVANARRVARFRAKGSPDDQIAALPTQTGEVP